MTKEERAVKAAEIEYPLEDELLKKLSEDEKTEFIGEQIDRRDGFKKGYLTAEKETIERVIEWLKNNADSFTWYNEMEGESGMTDDFYDEIRKAMEE